MVFCCLMICFTIPSKCQTVSIQIRPDKISGLGPNCFKKIISRRHKYVRSKEILFGKFSTKVFCGYSKEPSQCDGSFELPEIC